MKLVFLPSTRSDLLWMRTYYAHIFQDGAKRAADQYRRTCAGLSVIIRWRAVQSKRWRVCENSRCRARRSLSSTESLMTESKYCVSGISVVTVQGLPDRQQGSGSG